MSSGIKLEMETNFKNLFDGPAPHFYEAIPGFVIFFYDKTPLHRHCRVENPYRASWGDNTYFAGESSGDASYWENFRPIGKYVVSGVRDWTQVFDFFSSAAELKQWLNNVYYEGENYIYAGLEGLWPYPEAERVAILKADYCPIMPAGTCYAVLTYIGQDDLKWQEYLSPSFITDPNDYSHIQRFYEDCRYDPSQSPGVIRRSHRWTYAVSAVDGPKKCPRLMVYGVNEDRIFNIGHDAIYTQTYIYPDGTEMNNPHGPFLRKRLGIFVEGLQKCRPMPTDAHAPDHLDLIWPGTYKEGNSTWKQLCTKDELDPEHEDEWPEPQAGGQYSYPGPWDSRTLYVVGQDWDGHVTPFFSQISEDALHTYRRQIDGARRFDYTARFIPPSTSRGWGTSSRYKFGLDENRTPFGLERPNIMISQDGKYNDTPPTWQISDGYAKLLNDDLAEVSLPHTWGSPRVNGARDWDCIYPASWYMTYKTMAFSQLTSYDLYNSLFVRVNEYPGERVLERNPEIDRKDKEARPRDWLWPDEELREHTSEPVAKRERLGLTNYPWIPCFMGISVNDTEAVRTPKLCVIEEQENLYTENSTREAPVSQPADRTTTYCSEINVLGVVFDAEFFQGTAPPTADSLHHAPDMSDYILDSVWFNPSKVFGRTEVDREQAYLPPLAFNMDFVRQDLRNSRVFYPTRKGYISVDYTSKSKKVLQEISDRYISEGECTLTYIAPSRKAYTSKTGDSNSPRAITVTSSVYSSQTTTDAVLEQLMIESAKMGTENLVVPKTSIESLIALGATDISIDILSETATITRRV